MSHVDEGRLSEYLDRRTAGSTDRRIDGSTDRAEIERHLAECGECRARLEEVRAVRDRAAALLRAAAPAKVAMPQFAEIQARARARQAPRRVLTMRRLTALGWAATIVLAVGVGWLARGSFGFGRRQPDDVPGPAATTAAVTADVALQESPAGADPATGAPGGAAPLSRTAPPPQAAEPAEQDAAPAVAKREAPSLAAVPSPEVRRAEPQAPVVGNLVEREQAPAAKADAVEGVRARQAVAGVAAVAEEPRDAPGRGAAPIDSATNELVKRADDALDASTWVATTAQKAEQHLGVPLRMVEGLAVEGIRIGEVGGQAAVVVTQMLPGGEPLEVVQWHSADVGAPVLQARLAEEAPPARALAAPSEGAGRTEVVIARDGIVMVVRARVAADSLAVLAGRLR